MATKAANMPTLRDHTSRMDPQGRIAIVAEILHETNDVLDDIVFIEGNLPTGHKTTMRAGIPTPTWRKYNAGVQPNKSQTVQITDAAGMLETYAEVDKALADLNGNTNAFRQSEDRAFIEGMGQTMAETIFYGDTDVYPERFMGLAPRFNSSSADNAENVLHGGAASGQTDCASIWLVTWDPDVCHMFFPRGSRAGLQIANKGQVTIEDADGSGGRMEAYRTHYRWDAGLSVRDWRYVVRIANIDRSTLSNTYTSGAFSTGADLPNLMHEAMSRIPNLSKGRNCFYMDRSIMTMLRQQVSAKTQGSTLTSENVGGTWQEAFMGIPMKRVDALKTNEARIAQPGD